jgi:hypothetical protein
MKKRNGSGFWWGFLSFDEANVYEAFLPRQNAEAKVLTKEKEGGREKQSRGCRREGSDMGLLLRTINLLLPPLPQSPAMISPLLPPPSLGKRGSSLLLSPLTATPLPLPPAVNGRLLFAGVLHPLDRRPRRLPLAEERV